MPILLALTFDDWSNQMYRVMGGTTVFSCIYFVLLVSLGGFVLVNLFLAVVFEQFIWTQSSGSAPPSVVEQRKLVASVLSTLEFFQALTERERRQLSDALEEETYAAGAPVVLEGDPATTMYASSQAWACLLL